MKRACKRTEEMLHFAWCLQTLQMEKLVGGSERGPAWIFISLWLRSQKNKEKNQNSMEDFFYQGLEERQCISRHGKSDVEYCPRYAVGS